LLVDNIEHYREALVLSGQEPKCSSLAQLHWWMRSQFLLGIPHELIDRNKFARSTRSPSSATSILSKLSARMRLRLAAFQFRCEHLATLFLSSGCKYMFDGDTT